MSRPNKRAKTRDADLRLSTEAGKAAPPSAPTDESWVVSCPCGIHQKDYEDGERMIECEGCNTWQHTRCVSAHRASPRSAMYCPQHVDTSAKLDYLCPKCTQKAIERTRAAEHWLVRAADNMDEECIGADSRVLPDDLYGRILTMLPLDDQANLSFCVSKRMQEAVTGRETAWRGLCAMQKQWSLPSRPRKTWVNLYFEKKKLEFSRLSSSSDTLIRQIYTLLTKTGDPVARMTRLIDTASAQFGFQIDFRSHLVFERNSMLNLACLRGCPKCARELIKKGAEVNLADKTGFTPLMNAAWNGAALLLFLLLIFLSNKII